MFAVAFTGYRPEKMPFKESEKDQNYNKFRTIEKRVISRLIERGGVRFFSGMALGFDTWVAEDILDLQKDNNELQLICAIPFPGQADSWSSEQQKKRYRIMTQATSSIIVCEHYSRDCYFVRNRYMVDNADVVVCAFDGKKGGTAYTVDYALKQNKIVIQIDPTTAKVSIISPRSFD